MTASEEGPVLEIRLLRADEAPLWTALMAYAFQVPMAEMELAEQHNFHPDQTLGAFVDGELVSALTTIPYRMLWDGAPVPMGGIAAVAGSPEHRRRGQTARLLLAALERLRAEGTPLSALYPFSFPFYRRYGWELAAEARVYRVPTAQLAPFGKAPGVVRRATPAGAWPAMAGVYAAWAARRHGALVRDTEAYWLNRLLRPWSSMPRQVALWHPRAGAPAEGYLIYRFREERGEQEILAGELVALSEGATRGLLGFLGNHDSQVKHVTINVPPAPGLLPLLAEPRVECKVEARWMLRLVDVPGALAARRADPAAAGRFTLAVRDEWAPWNAGPWTVAAEGGHVTVRPAPGADPDLVCDIQTLSQLYSGYAGLEEAALAGRPAACRGPAERLLPAVLPRRPAFFPDFF